MRVLRLAADVDHGAVGLVEAGFADVVAGFLGVNDAEEVLAEVVVGGAEAELSDEVVFTEREEAGADFAVGGEADAGAGAAEGLCDWGDDADFAGGVGESVAACGFAGVVGSERDEGEDGLDAGDDFCEGDDDFGCPEAALFKGHELDEADDDVVLTGEVGEGFDLVVVESAEKDAVDFDGAEAGDLGGADAGEDGGVAAGDARDALEGGLIDGVHADGDAVESAGLEDGGEVGEEVSVGGEGEVEGLSGGGAEGG